MSDIEDKGHALIKAAHEYWQACQEQGCGGAVQWMLDTDGGLFIFTRGEYREQLMHNIESTHERERTYHFEHSELHDDRGMD